jgi:hypothetical protein
LITVILSSVFNLHMLVSADLIAIIVDLYLPQLGADLVTIFNDNTGVCGVAWMPVADYLAFSAVMRGCFTGYVLAHELGHNQVSEQHDAVSCSLPDGTFGLFK